jgi:SAM-dependent methyltransferase
MKSTDQEWEKYGARDPYFGVLNSEKFQAERLNDVSRQEFFATGDAHITHVLTQIREFIDPQFDPQVALDFGCGVGRLIIPLAQKVPEVVGVDISESMLAEAQKNCQKYGLTNIKYLKSDDALSNIQNQSFSLIHSYIVLQHIIPKRGELIIARLLDHLEPGGVAALHMPYRSLTSIKEQAFYRLRHHFPLANIIVNLLRGRSYDYPVMQMNCYNVSRLFAIIHERGITCCHIDLVHDFKHDSIFLYCQRPHCDTE